MRAWVDIVGYSSVKTNGIDDDDEFVLSPLEHSSRGVQNNGSDYGYTVFYTNIFESHDGLK